MPKTKNPIQTESITIRMPKDILNVLRTDSSRNLESLNTNKSHTIVTRKVVPSCIGCKVNIFFKGFPRIFNG
jgi:hypothetical protein